MIMNRLRRFLRRDRGVISAEGIIILPILIWAFLGTFTVFEAFRQKSVSLKASYTIADMLSRQVNAVDSADIAGLNQVFDYLTYSRDPSWIRVTSVYWDAGQSKFRRSWSNATHSHTALNDQTLQDFVVYIPAMATGDTVLLVETYLYYRPVFDMGLTEGWSRHVIVTRPRFASQVIFSS